MSDDLSQGQKFLNIILSTINASPTSILPLFIDKKRTCHKNNIPKATEIKIISILVKNKVVGVLPDHPQKLIISPLATSKKN